MTAYEVIDVTPDTDEWLEERRKSIGASEVAGVLGISPYQTPLTVYRSKHGVDEPFDPERAWRGHAAERLVQEYIETFRPELGTVEPAVMIRSTVTPWLHASLDRVILTPEGVRVPLQIKSAHFYGVKEWEDGTPPLIVQAQIQAEIHCYNAPFAYAGLDGGDMRTRVLRVERDQQFIDDYLIPATEQFWADVVAGRAPEPSTLAEVADVWPSDPDKVLAGSEAVLDAAAKRAVLLSDARAMEEEAKALTLAIAQYMQTAEVLTDETGNPVLTYKSQQGRRGVTDLDALEAAHPEFVKRGDPFKVMRHTKEKNK